MSTAKNIILIVDDNQENLKVLANSINIPNIEIAAASSGFDALDYLKQEHPALILLDIMMPDMDGLELCKRIKNNYLTANIPIIFISAVQDSDTIVRGLELGGADYLTKPFNITEINARIKTHLKINQAHKYAIELLHDFVKSIPDMNLMIDETGVVIEAFSTHEIVFEQIADANSIIGKPLRKILPKQLGIVIEKQILNVLATHKASLFEQDIKLPNINYSFSIALAPMHHKINNKAILSLNMLDITACKIQENQVNLLYEYNRQNLFFNTLLSGNYSCPEQNKLLASLNVDTAKTYICYSLETVTSNANAAVLLLKWLNEHHYSWAWQQQHNIAVLAELPETQSITAATRRFYDLLASDFPKAKIYLGAAASLPGKFNLTLLNAWSNLALINSKESTESNIFIANTNNILNN